MTANSVTPIDEAIFNKHHQGKIETRSVFTINSQAVLQQVYTPGVAKVCMAIAADETLANNFTARQKTVAIVTNGTAVLGLGNVGVAASLPVMEGKAALFAEFGNINGVPILLDSENVDDMVSAIKLIAPSFGAIQLEDIKAPECFELEQRLRECLTIPVLHDDQHGTAVVTLTALRNACRMADVDLKTAVVGQIGLGAAGIGIGALLKSFGVQTLLGCDKDASACTRFAASGGQIRSLNELMAEADIVVATTGVKGLIKPTMVRAGQIILALTNPSPEIEPSVALEEGARFAADGKSVNNLLGFPALFAGILRAGRSQFCTDDLLIAADTLFGLTPEGDLVPDALDKTVHELVAKKVAERPA